MAWAQQWGLGFWSEFAVGCVTTMGVTDEWGREHTFSVESYGRWFVVLCTSYLGGTRLATRWQGPLVILERAFAVGCNHNP